MDDNTPKPIERPSTITYAPNTISVQKGGDSINYNYTPDINQKDDTPTHTVAYEYCFGNPMDRKTAVNLKSIDTTGVNVSYYYSTSKIDTTSTLIGETDFTLQELATSGTAGDQVCIYVLVSPSDVNIPTTFTQSIVWYYGIPQQISIIDNVTNSVIDTQTIVSGQAIDSETLDKPTAPDGYYFDAWFYDKNFTQLVDGTNSSGKAMYARYHNTPSNWIAWDSELNGYYIINNGNKDSSPGGKPENLIIPTIYNDKNNGLANVIKIDGGTSDINERPTPLLTGIKSLILSSSITEIGLCAFWWSCPNLTNLDFRSCINLITIEDNAFEQMPSTDIGNPPLVNLLNMDLTNCKNLTTIGNGAFRGILITSIKIPKNVTSIGNSAFDYNFTTSIVVDSENSVYDSRNNCNAIIESATNTLIMGCPTTIIPNTVTSIGDRAFQNCSSLTSITIPSSVTSIGDYAFYQCSGLTSIDLSKCTQLTSIGDDAFYECYSLTSIGDLSKCTSLTIIGDCAFSYCSRLTSITLPSSLTIIGDGAFYDCHKVTSIIIPSSVIKIGHYAFMECDLILITFEDTSTWYFTSNSDYTGGTQIDVTDPSTNYKQLIQNPFGSYIYKV